MQVSKHQIPALNDEHLGLIATAHAGSYPSEVVLAPWEEPAARGVVELIEQQAALIEVLSENLVTIATFRKYVKAQFAETLLVASGMQAFLFDDNTIRMNWFWAPALGWVGQIARARQRCSGRPWAEGEARVDYAGEVSG